MSLALSVLRHLRRRINSLRGEDVMLSLDVSLPDLETLGAFGADWTFWKKGIRNGMRVFTGGVGTDCSFEIALAKQVSFDWAAYDPTPAVADWVEEHRVSLPACHFEPVGLWEEESSMAFAPPKNPNHISHTVCVSSTDGSPQGIEVPLKPIDTLCAERGWNHVDLLKLDIEGAEYKAIPPLLRSSITIDQLLVEVHHGMYGFRGSDTARLAAQMREAGYCLAHVSEIGREQTWIHQRLLDQHA